MAEDTMKNAPGGPGIEPRWTSSAKVGVGAALSNASRVWFTLSHGIIDEIYFARVDWACTRDMGLLVADGKGWVSEEKRQARHDVKYPFPGIPLYCLTNMEQDG